LNKSFYYDIITYQMVSIKISGNNITVPHLLTGSVKTSIEVGNGRMSLPGIWRPEFLPESRAYVATARLGALPYQMLFPGDNLEAILSQVDSEARDLVARSASPVNLDRQYRFSAFGNQTDEPIPRTVVVLGSISHLKILPTEVADLITANDAEKIHCDLG
jgi:hypothetical protein